MADSWRKPHGWQRALQRVSASRWGSRVLARVLHYLDRPLLQLTRGRVSLPGLLTGLPVGMLTTVGARSGARRTAPLVYIADGERVVLIASYFGSAHHPAWYHNLCAHPEATLTRDGRTGVYVARELTGPERERYWNRAVALYAGYAAYQRRAAGRQIPVLLLTPRPGGGRAD